MYGLGPSRPTATEYVSKLCDILDRLLAKTCETSHVEGVNFRLTTFHVSEQNTRTAEDGAIELLERFLFSDDPKTVLRGVE